MFRPIPFTVVLMLFGVLLQAQEDSLYQLPQITLQENRLETPFQESTRSVEVITSDQIRLAPVQSVAELLQYAGGVDVRQRGVHGVQADVSIRGGTFDQTLILVNGIKLNDPQTGHHSLNLPLDLENIERIEVLKGPGARVFGQNAFAGAINIITKTPEVSFLKIGLQGGQNQLGGFRVSAATDLKGSQHYFSYARDFSQGYRYNTDYNISNFFYQSSIPIQNGTVKLLGGLTERAFGANGFYASPNFADQFEAIQTSLLSVQVDQQKGNWQHQRRLNWRRNQDEYIFVRRNPSLYRNLHIGNTLSAEWNSQWINALGQLGLGLETQWVRLQSNNLGTNERLNLSAYLEHRFELLDDRLDLIPGLLANYFTDFGPSVFPGLDLGYDLAKNLKVFANIGRTYRVPTFTDLYYEDPVNIGNPDLLPESALTYEAGLKGHHRGLNWQASYFNRMGKDLIDWTRQNDTLPWQPSNFGQVQMQGADASLQLYFPVLLPNQQILHRLQLAYTFIDAAILEQAFDISRYALENLRHQFIAGLEYKIGPKVTHSIRYRFTDRVTLDDYSLVDTRLQYQNQAIKVFVEATNLLNTQYTETNLVPMPGRWLRVGVEWRR